MQPFQFRQVGDNMPPEELRSALQSESPFATTARERHAGLFSRQDDRGKKGSSGAMDETEAIEDAVAETSPWRRDFNLIRAILLEAEEPGAHAFSYDEFDRRMVQNHLQLLIEGGYLSGSIMREASGLSHVVADRLTWAGHDLLALLKNPSVWQRARSAMLDKGGRAHLQTLTEWLKSQYAARSTP
jgi:hypothetical protein